MTLKRILFSMMALLLTMCFMPFTIHAQENETKEFAMTARGEIPPELLLDKAELNNLSIDDISVYVYPVAKGTSPETKIGYISVLDENRLTKGLIELTGDMLVSYPEGEPFDASAVGEKTYSLPLMNSLWKYNVDVTVVENSDMSMVGTPVAIDVTLNGAIWGGHYDGDIWDWSLGNNQPQEKSVELMNVGSKFQGGEICVLDNFGKTIYQTKLEENAIPNFDSTLIGKKSYPISYIGLNTTVEVEFHKYTSMWIFKTLHGDDTFIMPLGQEAKGAGCGGLHFFVDENEHKIMTDISAGGNLPAELIAKIDTSKAGAYEIEAISKEDGSLYKAKVIVGIPTQSTMEELLTPEAQATLPSKDVLSVWDVPSGEAGAGTWVFSTGMKKGNTVAVWSYHNNKWLKIGTYAADQDGNISVTFKADQLSPVILVKGNATADNQNSSVDTNKSNVKTNIIKDTSKTKQTANALPVIAIFIFLGFAIFASSKERQKQNN